MRTIAAAFLAVTLVPVAAVAEEAAKTEKKDEVGVEAKSPFGLSLTLEQGVGVQTDADTTNMYTMLVVAPAYKLTENVKLTLSLAPYVEETERPSDGTRADFNTAATYLSLGHASLYKEPFTEINLSGSVKLGLPIARTDAYAPRYPTPSASVGLDRSFYGFKLSWAVAYVHYLPVDETKQVDYVDYGDGASARPDDYTVYGWMPFNRINNTFTLAYTPPFFEKLSATVTGVVIHTNSNGPSESDPTRTGTLLSQEANDSDQFWFIGELGYTITDNFSVALGLSNLGPQRPTGGEFGGAGSAAVNGGPLALVFSEQYAQPYLDLVATF